MASLSTCHLELVVWDGNLVKSSLSTSHLELVVWDGNLVKSSLSTSHLGLWLGWHLVKSIYVKHWNNLKCISYGTASF